MKFPRNTAEAALCAMIVGALIQLRAARDIPLLAA